MKKSVMKKSVWFYIGILYGVIAGSVIHASIAQDVAYADLLPVHPGSDVGVRADIDYSCDPDSDEWTDVVKIGPGSGQYEIPTDHSRLDFTRNLSRAENANALIYFMPGNYAVPGLYLHPRKGKITVCGGNDDNGDRPVLETKNGIAIFAARKVSFFNFEMYGRRTELVIANSKAPAEVEIGGIFLRDSKQNCIYGGDYDTAFLLSEFGVDGVIYTIRDTKVTRCGQGNAKHNLYLYHRPGGKLIVENSEFSGANDSHAFKAQGNQMIIQNNRFATMDDQRRSTSTTLVDIVACGHSVFANNIVDQEVFPRSTGSFNGVSYRARRSMSACDTPRYDSTEFNSPNFWAAAKAEHNKFMTDSDYRDAVCKLMESRGVFCHRVENNLFRLVETDDNPNDNFNVPRATAIDNEGTYPRTRLYSFSPASRFLDVPARPITADNATIATYWFERSVVIAKGNKFLGNYTTIFAGNRATLIKNPISGELERVKTPDRPVIFE